MHSFDDRWVIHFGLVLTDLIASSKHKEHICVSPHRL